MSSSYLDELVITDFLPGIQFTHIQKEDLSPIYVAHMFFSPKETVLINNLNTIVL